MPRWPKDRATAYAKKVLAGKSLAGPYVRGACQRHLNDLDHAEKRGFYYDEFEASEAISFFETILVLNGGQYEGKPFLLLGWQDFILGSIYGWQRIPDNCKRTKRLIKTKEDENKNPLMWVDKKTNEEVRTYRRFRVAYCEGAKGCGKSPIAAGIGIKGLVADGEPRAEIYAAATYRDQAMILFRDACAFYDQSPQLQSRLTSSGTAEKRWNLAYIDEGSFFRVISSEKKGQSGPRPHVALLDEIHEHTDGAIIELLRAGFKFRRQPLSFMITNSGFDKTSVCWEYHDMGAKIALEQVQNDEFFAYICAFDEEDLEKDKYLTDETLWLKVNPSLEIDLPGYDYIRGQVTEARGMPSKMATVKRLNFCVWTEAENPAFSKEAWLACQDKDYDVEILKGRRCWGGLDLSSVNDLTAFALMFKPSDADPLWRLKVWFWIPNEGIHEKEIHDHVPYIAWRDHKYLFASQGAAISKTEVIKFINEEVVKYDLAGIAYDRSRMKDLIEFAEKGGIELDIGEWDKKLRKWDFKGFGGIKMMPFGQQARSMAPAIDKFELYLLEKQFRHDGSPTLMWNAANAVVVTDDNEYRRISKKKSTGRVDGIVATVMACGIIEDTMVKSVYENMSVKDIKSRMSM